ncbi:permease prefix domain 1-containing protein [Stackebrandtia soli]|uniref:permease prefix domain 1-containing protein n=1 Tax=Stackebrandtia soli TaxID=1892856 RepID=UPI0039E8CE41
MSTDVDPITAHVDRLGRLLVGPRRAKADMLREVRHGLCDTADALGDEGLSPVEARTRAVAEFGDVRAVAAGYQEELTARRARFTLGFLAVTGPVGEIVYRIMWSNTTLDRMPPEGTFLLARAVDIGGWSLSVVAAALLVLFGMGTRWVPLRAWGVRFVAWGILVKLVVFAVAGAALSLLFGGDVIAVATPSGLVQGLIGPAASMYTLWLVIGCLRSARRLDETTDWVRASPVPAFGGR